MTVLGKLQRCIKLCVEDYLSMKGIKHVWKRYHVDV
jgi:hypothetical protein